MQYEIKRYFSAILKNLNLIGISLNDIYVQNLVADYQDKETAKNKHWETTAEQNISARISEFDKVDPTRKIPVILTAERLCHLILNNSQNIEKLIGIEDNLLSFSRLKHFSHELFRE